MWLLLIKIKRVIIEIEIKNNPKKKWLACSCLRPMVKPKKIIIKRTRYLTQRLDLFFRADIFIIIAVSKI